MVDKSVNCLGLSARATNALKRMEIHTLEQLLITPIEEIEKQKSVGTKTVEELRDFIDNYLSGEIDLNFLDNDGSFVEKKKSFLEDEIEEMSQYTITDLDLPARAENALLQLGCNTVSKLALMPENDLRKIKGLGKKSCDEVIRKLSEWIDNNMQIFDENDEKDISEEEKRFFTYLSETIRPIQRIYWRQLRELVNQNVPYISVYAWDIEQIDDEFISMIIGLDEFENAIRSFLFRIEPDGIIKIEELQQRIDSIDLQFNKKILIKRLFDGRICCQVGEVCYVNRPDVFEYLLKHEADFNLRNYGVLMKRLQGESLQEIGEFYNLTRERVRQILVKTVEKMPEVLEDYYRIPYEHFKFSKEEFCSVFPQCGSIGYEYLFIKYKKGEVLLNEESVEKYSGFFSDRIEQYWMEESIRREKRHVTKTELIYRVLMSNSDCALSMEEFEIEYNKYLERRNYPKERLAINIRTVSNHFRTAPHIVFNRENKVRYCEADAKKILGKIDFTQYKDLVISAELIYRDYVDLMEEEDIRDGYELFYVIKSSLKNWDSSEFEISCRRVPVMILGNGDEARQALQLLKEISPIDFYGYFEAYEERFGVRSANGNPVITGALAPYYLDGEYTVDVIAIDEEDTEPLKEALAKKKFWFIDEVEKLFHDICIHSSDDAFNRAAFKRIGYSLNIGYLYNDDYGTVVNYFDREIFSKAIINLNDFDHRLLSLSAFSSALYKKRMELEYIEVAPKVYMTVQELERTYGLSIEDIHVLQKWIGEYNQKYFNAHSVWNQLQELEVYHKLQENEWLCTCIFRQQPTVFSQQVAGGIILCKDSGELNLGSVCQWLVDKNGKMTVHNLTATLNDIFATRIPVSKIAERLKSFGLWDELVTDSFDEYIDNLVVVAEADLDDDNLFQEEFF